MSDEDGDTEEKRLLKTKPALVFGVFDIDS